MTENEITGDILDASIKLHRQFGAGLLESVYETLLAIELVKRGHKVERQKSISFEYEGVMLQNAFRLDMLVDDKVIVEQKSSREDESSVCKATQNTPRHHKVAGWRGGELRNDDSQRGLPSLREQHSRTASLRFGVPQWLWCAPFPSAASLPRF